MRINPLLLLLPITALSQTASEQIDSMLLAVEQFKTAKYELHTQELINDEWVDNISSVTYRKTPLAIYINYQKPHEGVEVLLKKGDEKALVNPNGFPYVNLRLDPYGYLMRADQHHTVFESGFDYFISLIKNVKDRIEKEAPGKTDNYLSYLGKEKKEEKTYHHIQIENPDFKHQKHIVKEGEDLVTIARKNHLNERYILEKNKLNFYDDVAAGEEITIPNSFAQKVELWIDVETHLPLIQKIYINNALYEQYEFKKMQSNILIPEPEFTADFEEYGF